MTEPATSSEISEVVRRASRDKLRVSVQGGGTKLGWGPPRRPADIVLSTRRMDAVLAHRHGDLTATIQAGAPLAAVNRVLARHGQWIPLDPPFRDRATIGGIVSTNDSGPRRHRYGAPRDLIIGVDMVRTDGVAAKAGGIVVKNVAGYDLARLITGSFGTLAVIASATFKLFPIPPASRTVVVDAPIGALGSIAASLAASQLTPTAMELAGTTQLLVRFESIATAAEQQAADAVKIAAAQGAAATIVDGQDETTLWDAHDDRLWTKPGAVIKVSMLPTDVGPTLKWASDALRDIDWDVIGRVALGGLLVRVEAAVAKQAAFVTDIRARFPQGRGSAVIVRGSDDLKATAGVWGPIGDSVAVMNAIKKQFDPEGILPACF